MGYMKIPNLYKDKTIMHFRKVWATEKIHGTSAWITYYGDEDKRLTFHQGGADPDMFKALFDEENLGKKLEEIFGNKRVKLHGEHYGGKIQGMSQIYGEKNAFVMFDIRVGDKENGVWLSFDRVLKLGDQLGLDVVHGVIIDVTLENLNRERDAPSVQSKENGIEGEHTREGIVIRPLIELRKNNNVRVIVKHKSDKFRETKTPHALSGEALKRLGDANEIAEEWCTLMRFNHVIDKFLPDPGIEQTMHIIVAMIEDIRVESKGEITELTKETKKVIGRMTAKMFKDYLNNTIEEMM